ncbi:putative regulator of nonsense transcripts protein 1 [Gregarina niphandrodes]|uniref:Regulator of nonsense transcripts protein 1 n=1 Tax=Gregarina niphandrodes TaxID=110365 RepID=A0A023AZX2_GRENI|nr:putative regulator of nonsense transcripts protein 1 [Gregarina niphandrodes]EZG43855.1 putative regulator of nonsense transcripts protein 1 [Gregarina niphandrodes]|eukprot:XP_011132943.1 putative regulator of nonsense transcripts protein 1 [Gregarina niphandrodes]
MDDVDKPGIDDNLPKVKLWYSNVGEYCDTFSKLVQAEADYDKTVKESQRQENVAVQWDVGLNDKQLAFFVFAKEDNESRVVVGDELRLKKDNWSCTGQVVRLTQTEQVCLELKVPSSSAQHPWDTGICTGFTVEFVWKRTSFDRMLSALKALKHLDDDNYLCQKLLGKEVDDKVIRSPLPVNFTAPNLASLNPSQVAAVKKALQSPLCLIQGPPGTGKTVTSATIVYHLVQGNKRENSKRKVLVVAPSNVAVDQLAEKIHRTGVSVVRVSAKSRETISSNVEFLCLHNQVSQFKLPGDPQSECLQVLLKLKEEIGELSKEDEKKLDHIKRQIESDILRSAEVICATCVAAGDHRLKEFQISHVLLDEATQATEPECLIPIAKNVSQVVLVGDHCQLGPVIMCKKAAKAGLSLSLFERVIMLGNRPMRLEVQYRMHPCLSEFPSMKFYDGALQNGVTLRDRQYRGLDFPWPNPSKPMFFYNCTGYEEISASGTSYLNRSEAAVIEKFVTTLLRSGLRSDQIGVITPYDGQRAYISTLFSKQPNLGANAYSDIEIASVDAFQGREKDFILLTCVRNNRNLGIGFLQDPRRLNVALTRAKYGLVICGNARVLSRQFYRQQHRIWAKLLQHFQKNDLIVEGPLNNMRVCRNIIPVNDTPPTAGEAYPMRIFPEEASRNELPDTRSDFEARFPRPTSGYDSYPEAGTVPRCGFLTEEIRKQTKSGNQFPDMTPRLNISPNLGPSLKRLWPESGWKGGKSFQEYGGKLRWRDIEWTIVEETGLQNDYLGTTLIGAIVQSADVLSGMQIALPAGG